jgi:hypothetical protein
MGKYFNKENYPFNTKEIFGFSSSLPKSLPIPNYGQVNQGYGGMSRILSPTQQPEQVQPVPILTPAGKSSNLFYMVKYYFFFRLFRSSLSWSSSRSCYSIRKWS